MELRDTLCVEFPRANRQKLLTENRPEKRKLEPYKLRKVIQNYTNSSTKLPHMEKKTKGFSYQRIFQNVPQFSLVIFHVFCFHSVRQYLSAMFETYRTQSPKPRGWVHFKSAYLKYKSIEDSIWRLEVENVGKWTVFPSFYDENNCLVET